MVVDYDPSWPETFELLRARVWPSVSDVAIGIEHVGSTSVPGLAAKPIIDMTIVVPSRREVPAAIARLAPLGYRHLGDLDVPDREAFSRPDGLPAHNLYLCPEGTIGIANQLAVRNYLRTHTDMAAAYGDLKKRLAREFPVDIESYVYGKTDLILEILRAAGLGEAELAEIERVNRRAG